MSKRINLSIDAYAHEKLTELLQKTDCTSFVQVVRKSLTVYDYMITAQTENKKIYIINKDGEKEQIVLI